MKRTSAPKTSDPADDAPDTAALVAAADRTNAELAELERKLQETEAALAVAAPRIEELLRQHAAGSESAFDLLTQERAAVNRLEATRDGIRLRLPEVRQAAQAAREAAADAGVTEAQAEVARVWDAWGEARTRHQQALVKANTALRAAVAARTAAERRRTEAAQQPTTVAYHIGRAVVPAEVS